MSDVFISYARSTEPHARRIAEALRSLGYGVWRDDELPAHRGYTEVIEERLKAAKAVVVIWSAQAAKSEWVQSEADRARVDHKLVQVSIDRERLPMPFDRIQCADLTGWGGDLSAAGWRKVAASIADLVGGAASAQAELAAPKSAADPLLAVLAFDNLSSDPEMAYFSDGVSEEVQQTVARGTDLKVVGRTSSFRYRGGDKALRRVAAELNATHVLDGAVRRSGTRVRISAQLIECARETTLWSDRFDGDVGDVFALQEDIAAAVAAALKVVFAPAAKSGPVNADAYEPYMKARELLAGSFTNPAAFRTAIELLERATEVAPDFARAWAFLARARVRLLRFHGTDEPYTDVRAKVIRAVELALALDPELGMAHLAVDHLEALGAHAERQALIRKALAVSPNDLEVIAAAAQVHGNVGQSREALALAKRAFELDPMNLSVANTYAVMLGLAGRVEETSALWDRFLAIWPDAPVLYLNAILYAGGAQDWDRIEALAARAERHGVHEHIREFVIFYQNLRTKDPIYAQGFLRDARDELARTGNVLEIEYAGLCKLGLVDEAFELMEQASFDYVTDAEKPWRGGLSGSIIFNPAYGIELMRDERFPRLCARLGLCEYWVKTERWPDLADQDRAPYDFKAECRRQVALDQTAGAVPRSVG